MVPTFDKTLFIVLGNGFSINLINQLDLAEVIDLTNLFSKSDKVAWPGKEDNNRCFLSYKNCKELWLLGARSTNTREETADLIGDIITSMNAYVLSVSQNENYEAQEGFHYKAYCQLISYLKNLFIYYNNLVSNKQLTDFLCNSGDALIDYISLNLKAGNKIRIITYNYDIFLERLLQLQGITYKMAGFDECDINDQMIIYKPHGSISFESKEKRPNTSPYHVGTDLFQSCVMDISDMEVNLGVIRDQSLIDPIIPPSGDANRIKKGWSYSINQEVEKSVKTAKDKDELIIYGISYSHVDRNELDRILTTLPNKIDVRYINPIPSKTLDMVLTSIFNNYGLYKEFYKEISK